MRDVFDLMEREQQRDPEKRKTVKLLQQNHGSENVILKDERAQRILQEFLVDGKTIPEIAEEHLISTNPARQIKSQAESLMCRSIYETQNQPSAIKKPYTDQASIDEFGYDIFDLMQIMYDNCVEEVKELLRKLVFDSDLIYPIGLLPSGAKVTTIGQVFSVRGVNEIFKIQGIRKKLAELESVVIELGLNWRDAFHFEHVNPVAQEPKIILSTNLSLNNFIWNEPIQLPFKGLNIITRHVYGWNVNISGTRIII